MFAKLSQKKNKIMLNKIKKLREITGAGIGDIKKALEEAKGDESKALDIVRASGQSKALKKAGREAKEGVLGVYVHTTDKMGSMVKLFCETDFVARNEEFRQLAKDIAMHISAMDPQFLKPEDVSPDLIEKERKIWNAQLKKEGKPKEILEKILDEKEKKFRAEISLLSQPFIKDPDKTINDLVNEKIGKIGENIQIGEFVRYEL